MHALSNLLSSTLGRQAMAEPGAVCLLKPSEYRGEGGTAVAGRVVIRRVLTIQPKAGPGGGTPKGRKGKGKDRGPVTKVELHISGSSSIGDILYVEAWGDAAEAIQVYVRGKCVSIQNAEVVHSEPKFSTSKLPYYLKIKGPVGIRTKIREVGDEPWTDVPPLHPLQPLAALTRVAVQQQVCVACIVAEHRDPMTRETKFGPEMVCNSMVQQGSTSIRCAFWREAASSLAAHDAGVCLLMHQVVVKHVNGGWELAATDATTIEVCPEDLAETLKSDAGSGGAMQCITRSRLRDWSRCAAHPSTLSALVAAIVPGQPRKVESVFFIHNLQVMGLSPVRQDSDAWFMESCKACKRQAPCEQHPQAGTENRWLFKLRVADTHSKQDFIVYHDQMMAALPELGAQLDEKVTRGDLEPAFKKEVLAALRGQPWSMKVTFRENEITTANELECRHLTPTASSEGLVLECVPNEPLPTVSLGGGCPLAALKDTSYDQDLGTIKVGEKMHASSVRLFVRISEKDLPDSESCTQDPHSTGLRVKRLVHCELASSSTEDETSILATAGPPSATNWLNRAVPGTVFSVVAMMTSDDKTFYVNWFSSLTGPSRQPLVAFAKMQYRLQQGQPLDFEETLTPKKRLKRIQDVPQDETQDTLARSLFQEDS